MKRALSYLLFVTLLLALPASAETGKGVEDYGYEFAGDGYDGEWVAVEALAMEFCQPEGWEAETPAEGAAYAARSADGAIALEVRLEAEGVEDIMAWREESGKALEIGEANLYDALTEEAGDRLSVLIACEDKLIAFDFTRISAEALSRDFALQIVGSACSMN